ncbi:MAG TPA: hypothetical protein VGJ42_02975 [Nitrososphaera sp.]|jgi:hypothetical protein
MPSLSSLFQRPLIIYDDKCYSCAKFAKAASTLSRGWIRLAGHYYSEDAKKAKEMIFLPGYDATKMFWLVNRSGAHGARSGLLPVAREIIVGMFRGGEAIDVIAACEYNDTSMSCYTPTNVFKRVVTMLSHGTKFTFE